MLQHALERGLQQDFGFNQKRGHNKLISKQKQKHKKTWYKLLFGSLRTLHVPMSSDDGNKQRTRVVYQVFSICILSLILLIKFEIYADFTHPSYKCLGVAIFYIHDSSVGTPLQYTLHFTASYPECLDLNNR